MKILRIAVIFIFVLFLAPSLALANQHICCQDPGASLISPTQCEKAGVRSTALVCNANQVCDNQNLNSAGLPTCRPPTDLEKVFGRVTPPSPVAAIGFGAAGIGNFLTNVIILIYVVAAIVFVFMVVISAFQWIVSGGDKEKIAAARQRLTWAIVGITLLALAFVIINLIGQITGFKFFEGQTIPKAAVCGPIEANDCAAGGKRCVLSGGSYRCI